MDRGGIRLKPLIETRGGVFCHLLEIGATKIIIDCGMGEDFDYSIYEPCADIIRAADCILITSFDIRHIGALGYFPETPVYCSVPTAILGQITLDDLAYKFKSFYNKEIFPEIKPTQIKFSQPFKINDLEICAYNGGYCVGNSVFKISFDLQSVIVGYNINQRKENYLDGFTNDMLFSPVAFITNSAYSTVSPYTLKSRDETLLKEIKGCAGKVIISVRFTRMVEILCIISKESIIVVSKYGKNFVDRLKSMIEWAGSKAGDLFSEINITFGKITDIRDHSVVIVINEGFEHGVLGTVLDRYNSRENMLLLIDRKAEEFRPERLNVYEFKYTIKEKDLSLDTVEEVTESESLDEDSTVHWSKYKKTFFVDKFDRRNLFPHMPRKVYNTDYGEIFKFNFEKKVENPIKEYQNNDVEEIETAVLVKTGIQPLFAVRGLFMPGISDFQSSKTVIESLSPQKIAIVNDRNENALFYCASADNGSSKSETILCTSEVGLGSASCITKVSVSEQISKLNFKKIGGKRVSKFLAAKTENLMDIAGDYGPILVGSLSLLKLRKALIEAGFLVEVEENVLVVGNKLRVTFDGDRISIETKENNLLMGVRNVIYKYVTVI